MKKVRDLTGQRFGKLVAVKCVGRDRHKNALWLCDCDCGRTKVIPSRSLVQGRSKSCGCLETGEFINATERHMHGGSGERLYRVWGGMRNRCYDRHRREYPNYGGRGIKVCDEWLHDYAAFRDWAYSNGYDPSLPGKECSIDRIDVDGDYCPSNCRWVTMKDQSFNKTTTRKVEYKGRLLTLVEASSLYGISPGTISQRIKRGWQIDKAIETPARRLSSGNASRVS